MNVGRFEFRKNVWKGFEVGRVCVRYVRVHAYRLLEIVRSDLPVR